MTKFETAAERAYVAYCESLGGQQSSWTTLAPNVREAWFAAADACDPEPGEDEMRLTMVDVSELGDCVGIIEHDTHCVVVHSPSTGEGLAFTMVGARILADMLPEVLRSEHLPATHRPS